MNSSQIDHALGSDPCTQTMWRGVYPIDMLKRLPESQTLPAAYVVNTAPSDDAGEHWVAFYFSPDSPAEFFDSYGFGPRQKELKRFLRSAYGHSSWITNKKRLQASGSTACGQYCIFYLGLKGRGMSMEEIEKTFDGSPSYEWNDGIVTAYVNKHFNLNTVATDYKFLIVQAVRSFLPE